MSRLITFGLVGSLLVSGCYIQANENGGAGDGEDPECDAGHGGDPKHPADAKSTTDGGSDGTSSASACKAHADCGAGRFCLLGSGQCAQASSCEKEADCLLGFNCDAASKSCLPASSETCGELTSEAECLDRNDCAPSYAGVDCSCGNDCKCVGGEPNCVCTSFEFFRCEDVLL